METAAGLVRELLWLSLMGFAPILLLAGLLGILLAIMRLRRDARTMPPVRRRVLQRPDAQRIARRIRRHREPCLMLAAAEHATFSKLGGAPDLPPDLAWPEEAGGQLRFLCQIDLAQARASGGPEWLPGTGYLYAFHSEDTGSPDQVRILYASPPIVISARAPRDASAWPYGQRPIRFVGQDSLPSLDWLGEDMEAPAVHDEDLEALIELSTPDWTGPLHKLGGYPDELQDEQMAVACEIARGASGDKGRFPGVAAASRTWRLLLQIDSDPLLGTDFGGGRLYVFVRLADAKRASFDETVTLWQAD